MSVAGAMPLLILSAVALTACGTSLDGTDRTANASHQIGPPSAPSLVRALEDQDQWVRGQAAMALVEMGAAAEPSVRRIVELFRHEALEVRVAAAAACGGMGQGAVPELITALADRDPNVRWSAASALGQMGPVAKEAVPRLISALQDEEYWVQGKAATALGRIGAAAVPIIRAALENENSSDRWLAILALGQIGPAARDTVPLLTDALNDPDGNVRGWAAYALGEMGPAAKDAVPWLMETLDDEFEIVREWARFALRRISPDGEIPNSTDTTADVPNTRGQARSVVTAATAVSAGEGAIAVAEGDRRMLRLLQKIADETPENLWLLGDARARRLRRQASRLPENAVSSSPFAFQLLWKLGVHELRLGNTEAAIAAYRQCYDAIKKLGNRVPLEKRLDVLSAFATSHLRLGENENCCARNTPESCILPIRGGGIHTLPKGSRGAIRYFKELLESAPSESEQYHQAKWLLNIAYMTLGEYPHQVPANYRISPNVFAPELEIPRFHNVAAKVGLDTDGLSGGVILDDFDNDGDLDVLTSDWSTTVALQYFQNEGDGQFVDRSEVAGLAGLYGGLNLVQADYDNDGDVDAFVLRGAWLGPNGKHPNSLLRNDGTGTFTDVTFEAGLAADHFPTQTAAWGDYNNDGHIDLFVGNETTGENDLYFEREADRANSAVKAPCQLFRNNGDGTFTDVAGEAGVTNDRWTKGVVWGDYNDDRWPDLYVSNFSGPNRLFRNNKDGTFTDVALQLDVARPLASFPVWFWDFNNDGVLDLFVTSYPHSLRAVASSYHGHLVTAESARLYRGDGQGGFEDVTTQQNLTLRSDPMGANFGDLNNDGYLDFYLGTGSPDYRELAPNVMYLNRGGRSFANVTTSGGFGHLQKGHAVALADLDNDGDQDVFEQMGGALPGDNFQNVLYENPGFRNHWITVKLVGIQSNRSAIGARIRVTVIEDGEARAIYKHVNSGGSFGANPLRQTIGLGNAQRIELLEVYWPTSDLTQRFADLPMDQAIEVVEGDDRVRTIDVQRFKLGG